MSPQPPSQISQQPPGRSPATLAALAQLNMGRVLRPLVNLFTVISFYFHLRQFLSSVFILRYDPDIAYVALLTAYAGHRELRRWAADPEVIQERARRGELFVVFWWAFYALTLTAANHIATYQVPEGLLGLCIQVTTIFFGTLTSQQIYKRRRIQEPVGTNGSMPLEVRVLDYLRNAKEPVRSSQLQTAFNVSQPTIWRTLKQLTTEGKVEWTGTSENDPDGGFRFKGDGK